MKTLLCNSVILLCALLFFTKGFLLIKLEIGHKSKSCVDDDSSKYGTAQQNCVMSSNGHTYGKLIILIVDALRYDFAFYQEDSSSKLPFHNNMPIFRDLIKTEGCKKARLWRFKADAPTTTMQRLKALVTGSLPTFIDVSENFASSEITEDNLIDQFLEAKMNVTFMGDDTWMGLFPGRFNKAFPYPAFDVKDLHLVDNGVIKHLFPELAENDWQILIGHFLGVDHCGHRYGPFHPEMPIKLRQMNDVISQVVNAIDNDTLLLVMGDHGMTPTGDHGGETFNEVSATLFAYSPSGSFSNCAGGQEVEVNQVDIVPTISLLLGVPIPFANLGIVIKDLLPETDVSSNYELPIYMWDIGHGDAWDAKLGRLKRSSYKLEQTALKLPGITMKKQDCESNLTLPVLEAMGKNLKQMHTYLKTYQEITKSLPRDQFEYLKLEIEQIEDILQSPQKFSADHIERKFIKIMNSARDMCRMVWARFNVGLMMSGLCILFFWLLSSYRILTGQTNILSQKCSALIIVSLLCICVFIPNLLLVGDDLLGNVFSYATCIVFLCAFLCHIPGLHLLESDCCSIIAILCVVIFSVSFTSNSFILNEDCMALYLFSSTLVLITYFKHPQSKSDCDLTKSSKCKTRKSLASILKGVCWIPPSYISKNTCCKCFYVFGTLLCARLAFFFRACRAEQFWCFDDDAVTMAMSNVDILLWTILSCLGLPLCVWHALLLYPHGKKSFHDKIILMSAAFCVFYWLILALPNEVMESLPPWLNTVFPRCSYTLMIIHFLFQWIDPTIGCVIMDEKKKNDSEIASENAPVVSHQTNLKSDSNKNDFNSYRTTIYQSISRATICLLVLFSLLLGPFHALAIPLWMISIYCFLHMLHLQPGKGISFDIVVVWNLLCSFWWFSTGHQASLSSIRWNAAFVGFQGNHINNIIPASLLVLDTFSMQILSSVCLPALLVWNRNTVNHHTFDKALQDTYTKHYCYHVIKIVGCMVAALIHRRHLMVWWIFAPRFLFELISFVSVMASSMATYTFVRRCYKRVQLHLDAKK